LIFIERFSAAADYSAGLSISPLFHRFAPSRQSSRFLAAVAECSGIGQARAPRFVRIFLSFRPRTTPSRPERSLAGVPRL